MRIPGLVLALLINGAAASAQTPAGTPPEAFDGDVVRVNTKLVRVSFIVTDSKGAPVPKLAQAQFHVFEDGTEQTIATFESVEQPLTAALLLDTSPSTRFRLRDIKQAAITFVNQLAPGDRLMVISFSDQVQVLTELTSDLEAARGAITNAVEGKDTRFYDALNFVNEKLKTIPGRKAVVVLTDGIDNASFESNAGASLSAAEESDLVVYPLQYDTFLEVSDYVNVIGPGDFRKTTQRTYPPGLGPKDYERASAFLKELAEKSGGRLFHADDVAGIKSGFRLIGSQLRGQYLLTYYPRANPAVRNRHDIDIHVDAPHLAIKSRRSYVR